MTQKFSFIAVIGLTNAGKSTLVNHLVGAKVSIVSPRTQTTRSRVLGIFIEGDSQLALVDTPGIFQAKRRMDRAMLHAAWEGAQDSDSSLIIIDAKRGMDDEVEAFLRRVKQSGEKNLYMAFNKIDLIPHQALLDMVHQARGLLPAKAYFLISAKSGEGVEAMRQTLALDAPNGPWLFEEDQLSDMPERLLAAEITREKLFLRLRDELPYHLTVETDHWEERGDGSLLIHQTIYVQKSSHRGIILGKNGQQISQIGTSSRLELQKLLERKTHLKLFVKLRENWQDDPQRYQPWNLNFNA